MCILAATSFIYWEQRKLPDAAFRAFFMPYLHYNIGAQPRELVIMANSALSNEACQREVGTVFFLPARQNHYNMFSFKKGQTQRLKTGKPTELNSALVKKEPNLTISSVEIAKLTEKNHKELLRSVRSMEPAWEKINERKFALVEYEDLKGEKRPMYVFDKLEYMYIISKFNDEIRAALVKRWYELEVEIRTPKRGVELYEHEMPLFEVLKKWLVIGDLTKVAKELEVTPKHVSRVKRGICRSHRVMEALIKKAKYNKDMGLANGYSKNFSQLALELFNPKNSLNNE